MPIVPRVRVEVGFAGPDVGNVFVVGDASRGRVGTDPVGGDVWTAITDYVRNWTTSFGASQGNQPIRRYEPGTMTAMLNDPDRRFDRDNLSGPYVAGGVSLVDSMVRVRVIAEWAGVAYPLWTGFSDDWVPDYQGNDWTYVNLTATDGMKLWTNEKRDAAAGGFGGELSGARVSRNLNSISWPVSDRLIDAGVTTLQATTLSGQAKAELELTQDTELGDLFLDQFGRAVFQDRQSPLTRPASVTSQVTFGDGGYALTGEIPYSDVQRTSVDDTVLNRVTIAREGGTQQLAENLTSRARYLTKSFDRSDLIMQTDSEAMNYAKAILYRFQTPTRHFSQITFINPAPEVEDVFWPSVLSRQIGDRITIIRRPSGGGSPITGDCLIRGIRHSSDGDSWSTTWVLQPADRFTYFTVGDSSRGRVGYNPVAF
jgi:hypothetical protein